MCGDSHSNSSATWWDICHLPSRTDVTLSAGPRHPCPWAWGRDQKAAHSRAVWSHSLWPPWTSDRCSPYLNMVKPQYFWKLKALNRMALTGCHKLSRLILIIIQRDSMGKAEKIYVLTDIAFLLACSCLLKKPPYLRNHCKNPLIHRTNIVLWASRNTWFHRCLLACFICSFSHLFPNYVPWGSTHNRSQRSNTTEALG